MTQFLSQQWLAYNEVESVNTQASKLVSWASNVAIIVELIARETQRRKCFKRKWIRICMPIFFTFFIQFSSNFQRLAGSLTKPLISLLHNFWVVVFLDQVGAFEDKKVENCSRIFRHTDAIADAHSTFDICIQCILCRICIQQLWQDPTDGVREFYNRTNLH